MDILELEQYNLADAVELHSELNPKLFTNEHLQPEVRTALLKIAQDFQEHLGVDNLKLKDITISGSNASYAYTPHSDIDLHLVVDMDQFNDNEIYKELFDAKKYQYNDSHDITVRGYDVELYVQDADQPHHSAGIYSLVNDDWIKLPVKQRVTIQDRNVKQKYESLKKRIESAVKTNNKAKIEKLFDKIKDMRKAGLERTGEFGPENLAYKMLRTQGLIDKLVDARQSARSDELSIDEAGIQSLSEEWKKIPFPKIPNWSGYVNRDTWMPFQQSVFKYCFAHKINETKSRELWNKILSKVKSTRLLGENYEFSKESFEPIQDILDHINKNIINFKKLSTGQTVTIGYVRTINFAKTIDIAFNQVTIQTIDNNNIITTNNSNYPLSNKIDNSLLDNGIYFVINDPSSFETWLHLKIVDNKINDWEIDLNSAENYIKESASGYIPSKKQSKDPRWSHALTVDIGPDAIQKNAAKLGMKTTRAGLPPIAQPNGKFKAVKEDKKLSYILSLNGKMDPETWMSLLEMHVSGGKSLNGGFLIESVNKNTVAFINESLLPLSAKPILHNSYYIVPLFVTQNNVQVYDTNGQWPAKSSAMLSQLIKINGNYLTFKNTQTNKTFTYPDKRLTDISYFVTLLADDANVYDKLRLLLKLKLDIGLPDISRAKLKETRDRSQKLQDLKKFIAYIIKEIGIDATDLPPIRFTDDKHKVKQHHTFGTTAWGSDGNKNLWVYVGDRNMADVLRTLCHELIHVKQFQQGTAHGNMSAEQEQYIEDEANALAGRYLRDYGKAHEEIYESLLREYQQLDEVKTSPANLEKWADSADARGIRIGFEIECILPNVAGGYEDEPEPDFESWDYVHDIDDIIEFFKNDEWGYGLTTTDARNMREKLWEEFLEWRDQYFDAEMQEPENQEKLNKLIRERLKDDYDYDEEAIDQAMKDKSGKDYDDCYYNSMDELRDEFNDSERYDQSEWLEDLGIENSYDAYRHWDGLYWPIYNYPERGGMSYEEIADQFQQDTGIDAIGSDSYHSESRADAARQGRFIFEPDSSLEPDNSNDEEGGVEIVTPPLPLDTAFTTLEKVFKWIESSYGYTNESTGLHMNISIPDQTKENIDYVKLVLFMGDQYLLDRFDRRFNHFCKSSYDQIKGRNFKLKPVLEQLKKGATKLASSIVHDGGTSKYSSANNKNSYIEFRGPGGDYLNKDIKKIKDTALRFARALKIASDPEAYKTEYAKKFYKLLTSKDNEELINLNKLLSWYVSMGPVDKEITLPELIEKYKQQREVARPKEWYIWSYERPDDEKGSINNPLIYKSPSAVDARDWAEGEYGWRNLYVKNKEGWDESLKYYKQSLSDTQVHPEVSGYTWILWSPDLPMSKSHVVAADTRGDALEKGIANSDWFGDGEHRLDATPYVEGLTKIYTVRKTPPAPNEPWPGVDTVQQDVYALGPDQAKETARAWNKDLKDIPVQGLTATADTRATDQADMELNPDRRLETSLYYIRDTTSSVDSSPYTTIAESPAIAKLQVSREHNIPVSNLVVLDREPLPQKTYLAYSPTLPDIDPVEVLATSDQEASRIARQTARMFQGAGIDIVLAIPGVTRKFIISPNFENRPKGQSVPSQIVWETDQTDAVQKAKDWNTALRAYNNNQLMWVVLESYTESGVETVGQPDQIEGPEQAGNYHLLNHNGSIDRQVTNVTLAQAEESARRLERELDLTPNSIQVRRMT